MLFFFLIFFFGVLGAEALRSMSVQPSPRPNQQGSELDAVVLKKRLDKYSLGLFVLFVFCQVLVSWLRPL